MPDERKRTVTFDTSVRCPRCSAIHQVVGVAELTRQPIVFGGGSSPMPAVLPWTATYECPRRRQSAEADLLIPAQDGDAVRSVTITAVTDDIALAGSQPRASNPPSAMAAPASPSALDWVAADLAQWRSSSAATARTYASTMLTTSSGAVAVYFAILKYLGYESSAHSWGWVTAIPPILFLAAVAAFTLAIRPSLSYVDPERFAEYRADRIEQMYRRGTVGAVLYGLAVVGSIAVFLALL